MPIDSEIGLQLLPHAAYSPALFNPLRLFTVFKPAEMAGW